MKSCKGEGYDEPGMNFVDSFLASLIYTKRLSKGMI